MTDLSHRFLFDNTDIRGEIIQLDASLKEVLEIHHYPPAVANMIGQFMAASALLGSTIKFDGSLILQARSEGQIPVIMAEYNSNRSIRAIARQAETATSSDFDQLLGGGTLAITIDPLEGKRYQGLVALTGDTLASAVEYYFIQSEQLDTILILASNGAKAAGLLLQALPPSAGIDTAMREDRWLTAKQLVATISDDELLNLDAETLLYRLFHEEGVRMLESDAVKFDCHCSSERVATALISIGETEVRSIIEEDGKIEMNCEFCNSNYPFLAADIDNLFNTKGDKSLH
ncbi:MAG: molecular chaperone Hsp33 [Pseudomonadales bacterium]|jgi:molecular chaperone Hsp33